MGSPETAETDALGGASYMELCTSPSVQCLSSGQLRPTTQWPLEEEQCEEERSPPWSPGREDLWDAVQLLRAGLHQPSCGYDAGGQCLEALSGSSSQDESTGRTRGCSWWPR